MATVTIQITASGNTVGRTKTVSGAHLIRLLAAMRTLTGNSGLSDDDAVLAWADWAVARTREMVKGIEGSTAASSVTEIDLT